MRTGGLLRWGQVAVTSLALAVPWSVQPTAEPAFDARSVAVHIQRTPPQSWPGYGIYLGDGLVITAAHVAGHAAVTHPSVVLAGRSLPTETVKEGSYSDNDLTVLRVIPPVPPELADRHTTVCNEAFRPGEAVVVATPEEATRSIVISPEALPPQYRTRYASSIRDVYTTGNSGSGVFDEFDNCLLGIMSSKIEEQQQGTVDGVPATRTVGLAKHFVPASDIRAFLADVPRR